MKKFLKTSLILCMVVALFCSASVSASAAEEYDDGVSVCADVSRDWHSATVKVPGTNGSVVSSTFDYKGSDDSKASFVCTEKSEDRNFDARIVNVYNESRSGWARDLDIDDIVHANTSGAVKGYKYYCQVSSELLSVGATTVTLAFSADYLTSYSG